MSKSSEQHLSESENESEIRILGELNHYQRTQLELRGNIIPEVKRRFPFDELANEPDEERDGNYQNSIFSQLNPPQ